MERSNPKSTKVAMVSFDISKAFDSVSHARLFGNMRESFTLPLNAKRWLHSFVTGRTQAVKVGTCQSKESTSKCGVPQGTVLGPILYNMATVGLKNVLLSNGSSMVIYADDLLLIKSISTEEQERALQEDCNSLNQYYKEEMLELNGKKTKLLVISLNPTGSKSVSSPLTVNDSVVDQVENLKYLGVTFDHRISFRNHAETTARKARRMLGAIGSHLRKWHMSKQIKRIFSVCIRPILSYGSVIVCGKTKVVDDILERVVKSACRMTLNEYRDISYNELLNRVEWTSLSIEYKRTMAKLIFKNINKIRDRNLFFFEGIEAETARRTLRLSHELQLKIQQPSRLARTHTTAMVSMIHLWNSLPSQIVNSATMDEFDRKISELLRE
jgi:hypothetical protein